MKRLFFLIVLTLLMCGIANAVTLIEGFNSSGWGSPYGNYTVNNWSLTNVFRETTNKYEGVAAVRFNTSGSVKSIVSPLKNEGIGTLTFWYRRWSASDGSVVLNVFKSADGTTWGTSIGSVTASSDSYNQYSLAVNDVSAKYIKVESASTYKRCVLDYFEITDPVAGNIPPSITSIATDPASGITSLNSVSISANITDSDGTVEEVELSWGTSTGNHPNHITMSGSGSTYTTVTNIPAQSIGTTVYYVIDAMDDDTDISTSTEKSYYVNSPPPPSAPVATDASSVGNNSFTANWNPVTGATSYRLDVFTKSAGTYATDLFISEYIEGSSNNKYIEIYNGTGVSIDLSGYYLRLFANGAAEGTPTQDMQLSGTLSSGACIVYKNASAALTLPDGITPVTSSACNFNGNDAVALYKTSSSSYVDIFGRIGNDPGTAWTGDGGYTTLDKTLVRKSTVTGGITTSPTGTGPTAFTSLTTEWDMYNQDTASYLGYHTMSGSPTNIPVTGYTNLTVNGTIQTVSGLSAGTTYYYVVRAINDYGTSSNSNEISVSTTAPEVVVNADGSATGATIVTGGSIPASLQGPDTGIPAVLYTITSTGTRNVTVYKPNSFNGDWYCWLDTPSGLLAAANPIASATLNYVFSAVDFDAKGDVVVVVNDNSTLPVELSSFTAIVNSQNMVSIQWVSQSETNLNGYYVNRSASPVLSEATIVSPLISASNTSNVQLYQFTDSELVDSGTYYYWLQVQEMDGSTEFHGPISVIYNAGGDPGNHNVTPIVTEITGIYPNPFNPSATIRYALTKDAQVNMVIYNARGQIIRTMNEGFKTVGTHPLIWDGKDNTGRTCSTGVYFFKMQAGNVTSIKKAVLMK